VTAFASDGRRLWSRAVSGDVSRVEVADLRGDGSHEVIVATNASIQVFDRAGVNIWSANESGKLETFLIDHLLRHDPTLQITGVWNGDRESHVSTYEAGGGRLSTFTLHGRLQRIAIDRPTTRHNFRIIATGTDDDAGAILGIHHPVAAVLVINTKSKLLWKGVLLPSDERVARFEVERHDAASRQVLARHHPLDHRRPQDPSRFRRQRAGQLIASRHAQTSPAERCLARPLPRRRSVAPRTGSVHPAQ
jgi:hypothetical protein